VRARARRPPRSACPPRGSGLVEVLVALLLVAFAMLGVARLQLGALESGRKSLDALAMQGHVLGLAERIRALHDAPDEARAALAAGGADHGCRGERRCTPVEFAEFEAWSWREDAALRDAEPAPIAVQLEARPARFGLSVRRRSGAPYGVEVSS
jgi:hypothetical protein